MATRREFAVPFSSAIHPLSLHTLGEEGHLQWSPAGRGTISKRRPVALWHFNHTAPYFDFNLFQFVYHTPHLISTACLGAQRRRQRWRRGSQWRICGSFRSPCALH